MKQGSLEYRGSRIRDLPRRNRTYPAGRSCAEPGCSTKLSIYNRTRFCWQHEPLRAYVARGRRKKREAA